MVGAGQRLSAEEKLRLEIFISSVYISLTFPTFLHHQAPAHPCTGEHKGPVCVATVMSIRACQRGDKSNKQCEGEHCDALFHSLVHLCLQSKPVCPDVVRQTLFVYSKSVFSDHHWASIWVWHPWLHGENITLWTNEVMKVASQTVDCAAYSVIHLADTRHWAPHGALEWQQPAAAELQCSKMNSVAWEC